jgi:hypothetical protein
LEDIKNEDHMTGKRNSFEGKTQRATMNEGSN